LNKFLAVLLGDESLKHLFSLRLYLNRLTRVGWTLREVSIRLKVCSTRELTGQKLYRSKETLKLSTKASTQTQTNHHLVLLSLGGGCRRDSESSSSDVFLSFCVLFSVFNKILFARGKLNKEEKKGKKTSSSPLFRGPHEQRRKRQNNLRNSPGNGFISSFWVSLGG
jgi:hypothetical protein